MIQDIFKVPLYEVKLDLDTKNLEHFCKKHQTNNPGRVISNVGGYQSNDLDLLANEPILSSLLNQIQIHSNKFAKEFIDKEQALDNIWININSYKDTNKSHKHVGCDISGVYYVKTSDDCGNIVFEHPAKDVFSYYFYRHYNSKHPKEFNEYNSMFWSKPAVENILYLFPSWLNHYVEPNLNKTEERISFSFNAY